MAEVGAKHPLWKPEITFRSNAKSLAVTVHGSGRVAFSQFGGHRVDTPDTVIRFRNGGYTAKADRLLRIYHIESAEPTIVDEVQYMLTNPHFFDPDHAPKGGVHGFEFHIERGDEDGEELLDRLRAADRANPGSVTNEQFMKAAAAVEGARRKIAARRGPRVVSGIRDESAVPQDVPDAVGGDPWTDTTREAPQAVQTAARQALTSRRK